MKRKQHKKMIRILIALILVGLLTFVVIAVASKILWKISPQPKRDIHDIVASDGVDLQAGDSFDGELSKIKKGKEDAEYIETDGKIAFSGRWFSKEINGQEAMVTVTQGAMMYFKVSGSDVVTLNFIPIHELETPYYAYIIDGGEPIRKPITDGEISLPDKAEHIVQVVIDGITEREDKWYREIGVAFAGATYEGEMVGVLPDKKRILFYGDSITEGIMTLSGNAISDYNSATHGFAWYTSELLNAEPYYIGYGFTGIFNKGSFSIAYNTLFNLSIDRLIPETDYPTCDLIVVEEGTNDFGIESEEFIREYRNFIEALHNRYPDVKILCMTPVLEEHVQDVKDAVAPYDYCVLVDASNWELTYSDDMQVHPDENGSRYMADKLYQIALDAGYEID